MGTSEGLEGGPGIDCCVGAIVWVRRRNGSWWPGRILGSDELSASHVMSPRSGTPVKLLGREDASVDWYNLEKSKRVKAFRCGEFDECIERAESSQGIPIKKREKYARREDAILHALELEKQNLEKREQKAGTASNHTSYKMPNALRKELGSCSPPAHYSGNDKTRHQSKFISLKTQPHSRGLDLSLKEESMGNPQFAQKVKHAKELSLEDDNSEAIPRMRGLQDFGLRIAPLKRKFSASVAFGSSQRSASVDSRFHSLPNHVSCGKNFSAIKKRTQGGLTEEPLAKKRDRRRPLVQVLQSSAKLLEFQTMQSDGSTGSIAMQGEKEQADVVYRAKRSRCVYLPVESNDCLDHIESPSDKMQKSPSHFPMHNSLPHLGSLTEENTSSILIEEESDSGTDHTDSDMDGEAAILSDPRISERSDSQGGTVFRVPEQPGNMDNEELDESELPGYISQLHYHEQAANVSADMGGSNWQLKRKRNIRNSIKRPMEAIDGRDSVKRADTCNGRLQVSIYEGKGEDIVKMTRRDGQMALKQGVYHRHEELNNGYDEGDLIENDSRQIQMSGFGNRRYSSMLKAGCNITDSEEDSHQMTLPAWEAGRISQSALRGYREESDDCFDRIYAGHLRARMEPMLLDVDLKVQASYQGERVPLVSLMSRLNGKAIIGHPIQIETMEDGSSDIIFSKDGFYEEPLDSDGNTALPSVWRTARRTTLHRVPHPHPSSALEGEEVNPPQYSDIDSKPPPRKPFHKERFLKNSHLRQPPTENNSPKKILKKSNLSSQKTRTLSSIATDQKTSGKNSNHKLAGKNAELDVSIKSEKTAPVATCIPVKLVFSRILEAVSRLPLKAATQRISTASLADRNPS